MKKTFLIIFLAVAVQQLSAQTVRYGITAGYSSSQAAFNQPGVTASFRPGFTAGGFAELRWGKISFEPSLLFAEAGYDSQTSGSYNYPGPFYVSGSSTVKLRYLEIPLHVLYNINADPFNVFIGGGPYVSMAISGTTEGQQDNNGFITDNPKTSIDFGAKNSFNRLDFGMGIAGGFTSKRGIMVSAGYNFGLANIVNAPGTSVKNMVWNISVGYEFR